MQGRDAQRRAPGRRLLVLTGGAHQASLIRRARALGVVTIVADRDADAPAMALADYAEQVSATDVPAILALARRYGIDGIIAEQTDVAVRTAAVVAAELGLAGTTPDVAFRATDKFAMREACRVAGLPLPSYRLVASESEATAAAQSIGVPVVIKPTDSQASRGVTKVFDLDDVPAAFAAAREASTSGGVLVEEMMIGTEGSIESVVADGVVTVLGFCDKRKCAPPYSYDLELQYPGRYEPAVQQEIIALNDAMLRAVGISTGLSHLEFIVTAAGVRPIEVAARGCGARVATDLLPALTGIDIVGLRIRQALGETIIVPEPARDRYAVLRFLELSPGRVGEIAGVDEALLRPDTLVVHLACKIGDVIKPAQSGDGRPGFVITAGATRAAAEAAAEFAIGTLQFTIEPSELVEIR